MLMGLIDCKRIKKQFFTALVMSVLLYNVEAWAMTEREMTFLSSQYMRLVRSTIGKHKIVGAEGRWETDDSYRRSLGIEDVKRVVMQRKTVWLGHMARRTNDTEAAAFLDGRNRTTRTTSRWWKSYKDTAAKLGVQDVEEVLNNKNNKAKLKKMFVALAV